MRSSLLPPRSYVRPMLFIGAAVGFLVISLELAFLGGAIASGTAATRANRDVALKLRALDVDVRRLRTSMSSPQPPPRETTPNVCKDGLALEPQGPRLSHVRDTTIADVCADLWSKIMEDPDAYARGARIVPFIRDGAVVGFKLYAIRPGSVSRLLGLENGDAVLAINGMNLASPDRALEIYSKLRTATSFDIEIERDGKRHRMIVLLHEACSDAVSLPAIADSIVGD